MKRTASLLLFGISLCAQFGDPREAHWTRLSSSNFDLYTDGPEKEGRDLLRSFEQIRGFFQKASPVPLNEDFPIRIVAFASKDQFAFYSPGGKVAAYYVPGPRTDYIVMRDATPESHPFGIHEYMHMLVRHSGLRLPVWLNEGWADVYSTLRPVRDGVAVGDLIPMRVKTLDTATWLSMKELTAVTSDSRLITENERVGIFYAESWALAHMLFLSPEYSENFPKFLSALNRGRPEAEAFQTAWNRTPDQVFADLQSYMKRSKLTGRVFEAALGKQEQPPAVSKLDSFDARLMLADLSVALGRRLEAKREYESLSKLRPDDRYVSEALGFAALSVKENAEARENFEKAFAAGDTDPLMCFQLALLEGAAQQPRQKVLEPLKRALQSKPDYVEAQYQMGLFYVALHEYSDALTALMGIKKVTPERASAVFSALAYAHFETGDLEKARADLLTAKKWAVDTRQLKSDEQLLALIDARAAIPQAPHPGEKITRIAGMLKGVDCASGSPLLALEAEGHQLMFTLPDTKAVEFVHTTGGTSLKLACGPQEPQRVVIGYAPGSVMQAGPAGVVRLLEY